MNNVALSIYVPVFVSENGNALGFAMVLYLHFQPPSCFLKVATSFYISIRNVYEDPQFAKFSSTFPVISSLLCSTRSEVISHCGFGLHFSNDEHIFMCLLSMYLWKNANLDLLLILIGLY
jgi:hypothetical protein